ncbi:MAG: DUF4234 domain-containing protein [Clostridia bacterium]|nr:DUF4234 domain-containing protein [Clostridia bacterium]
MQEIKKRDIVLNVILSIVTFGIYGIYWAYTLATESSRADDENESTVVIVLLMLLVPFVGVYFCEKKLVSACEKIGMKHEDMSLILLLISILGFPIVGFIILQDTLNKIVDFNNENIKVETSSESDSQE